MPREYLKTAENTFTPVADTQGLLVPQPVRYTRFKPSNILVDGSAGESHNYYVAPTPAQCAAGGGENWNNGTNRFYFPKAGIYTISYPSFYIDNNSVAVIMSFLTNREAKLISIPGGGGWKATDMCVRAQEGDWIQIGYNCSDPTGYTIDFNTGPTIGFFYIYLNEVAAPYIVANKGALVSSDAYGKVKIADDGTMGVNGGYSTAEVNTGETWINGRPIYKRTFTVSPGVSLAPGASVGLGSSGEITTVLRHEVVIDGQALSMTRLNAYNGVYTIMNLGGVATGGGASPWIVTVWGCKAS
jgi:hypothetical protein